MEGWQIENCVLYVVVAATIVALYHLSGSWHSLWVLLMLGATNSPTGK